MTVYIGSKKETAANTDHHGISAMVGPAAASLMTAHGSLN